MSDIGSVQSYAAFGLRLWAAATRPHGLVCPCLICADTRAYTGWLVLSPDRAALFGVTLVLDFEQRTGGGA